VYYRKTSVQTDSCDGQQGHIKWMKYTEGGDGLEGRNGGNSNSRAEERNSRCNTPLIFPGILCDVLIRTRKRWCSVLPRITSVSERDNPLGRKRANSSLVFKRSPGC